MKVKHWTKPLRTALCVGILGAFLLQFAALADTPDTDADAAAAKISPRLLEAFSQNAPMTRSAGGQTVPAMILFEDAELSSASASAAESAGLLDTAPLTASGSPVTAGYSLPSAAPANGEDPAAVQDYIEAKRLAARQIYAQQNEAYAAAHFDEDDILYISQYSPVILAGITQSEAYSLAAYSEVVYLELYEDGMELFMDNALTVVKADYVRDTRNYKGGGVKVGVLDGRITDTVGLPSSLTIRQDAAGTYDECMHGKRVTKIIMSMAPNATYYAANLHDWMAGTEWLLSQGVNVINISGGLTNSFNAYTSISQWFDHIAFNHDVHLVMAAGNHGSGGIPTSSMAFNAITVGSINDFNSTDPNGCLIEASTSYMTSVPSNVASKPDMLAPGVNISVSLGSQGTAEVSGTSFAAPIVTGTVVYLCQLRSILKTRQDLVKSLLCTSAVDLSYTPTHPNYMKCGAGLINANVAWLTANRSQYGYNYIDSSHLSYTYTKTTSSSTTYLRVALAYLNYSKYSSSSHTGGYPDTAYDYPPDLDLEVYNSSGTLMASSTMGLGRNVEIVRFNVNGAGTYTIKVKAYGSPGTKTAYFGVSWY